MSIEIDVVVVKKHVFLNFVEFLKKYVRLKVKTKDSLCYYSYHYQIYLNMPECCYLYKQDSEYALGLKYAKILNMTGFSVCECYSAF